MAEIYVNDFLYPFLKDLEESIDERFVVHLCAKSSLELIGSEKADFLEQVLPVEMTYEEAMLEMKGKAKYLG